MKFEQFKTRYNTAWDRYVVTADIEIKTTINRMLSKKRVSQFDEQICVNTLKLYTDAVRSLVENLVRQFDSFEDKENAAKYLKLTLDDVNDDLELYARKLMRLFGDSSGVRFIDSVKSNLESLAEEVFSKAKSSSAEFLTFESCEEHYNEMWNRHVVPADTKIRKMLNNKSRSIFKFDEDSCIKEIHSYVTTACDMINEIAGRLDDFSDKSNAYRYIQSTIESVTSDLDNYSRLLGRHTRPDSNGFRVINNMKLKLDAYTHQLFASSGHVNSDSRTLSDDEASLKVHVSDDAFESLPSSGASIPLNTQAASSSSSSDYLSETGLVFKSITDDSLLNSWLEHIETHDDVIGFRL